MFYEDKELMCLCKKTFVFTGKDQRFYAAQGFSDPKRCHQCRAEKKQQRLENEADRDA